MASGSDAPRQWAVEHDGFTIGALDWGGDGPPLVLLHPNGFCAGVFDPLARALTADHRVVGVDLRGHVTSDAPTRFEDCGFVAAATDVVAGDADRDDVDARVERIELRRRDAVHGGVLGVREVVDLGAAATHVAELVGLQLQGDEMRVVAHRLAAVLGNPALVVGQHQRTRRVGVAQRHEYERIGGGLDPSAGRDYVRYGFALTSRAYKTTYQRATGPNPETSTVTTDVYQAGFTDLPAYGENARVALLGRLSWNRYALDGTDLKLTRVIDGSSAVLLRNVIGLRVEYGTAAAVLIASREKARALGLEPWARYVGGAVAGSDPIRMLTAPIPATQRLLHRTGLSIGDVGSYEINEAFAPIPLAWLADLGADPERLNPEGGAIAMGHPLGASGAILMTRLLHRMRAHDIRYGLQAICEGGGTSNATLLELC